MPDLPTGTITFLFTDVEGSTKMWEQQPEEMRLATVRHDAIIESIVEQQRGMVVRPRGEGDSRFAVFVRARDSVAAACDIQRALAAEAWPTLVPIRIRIALHTGEADLRDGDYYGPAVNRCARLRTIGNGGQVLLSRTTANLVEDDLPQGVDLRDLGEHRLKDMVRPEHVFQLLHPDLPSDFPPLKTLESYSHNLPFQLTSFVGRTREIAEVKRVLETSRLVTLTGPGGSGKTRLALQVATDMVSFFADGVFQVQLASIADPELVIPAIAATLGVKEINTEPLAESLKKFLRNKEILLVLDNFEQVVDAAPLVSDLLGSCRQAKVLATSQEALRLRGEVEYVVPTLGLPEAGRLPPVERLLQFPAVRLFVERARSAALGFAVTIESAPAVVEICRKLDGLPLALELAAARVRLLPPADLLAHLERRLAVLTEGARDLPPRQRTMRNAIAWSYDLLDQAEQALFRGVSVFVGGFTREAAEAVVGGQATEGGGWRVEGSLSTLNSSRAWSRSPERACSTTKNRAASFAS